MHGNSMKKFMTTFPYTEELNLSRRRLYLAQDDGKTGSSVQSPTQQRRIFKEIKPGIKRALQNTERCSPT